MASKAETNVVYAAGMAQGIVLVTFPAASTVFDRLAEYGLVEHAIRDAVPAAGDHGDHRRAARAGLGGRFGTKRVYIAGLAAALVSMSLLIVSDFVKDDQSAA